MKIELKNFKYSDFASHETPCFEATIVIDGKRRGTVSNDGRGGSNCYHPYGIEFDIQAYAMTLPAEVCELFPEGLAQNADSLISRILDDHLLRKELKRKLKTKAIFIKDGTLMEGVTKRNSGHTVATVSDYYKAQGFEVLNLLPFESALNLYIHHARASA